jgi:uncharacterized membrane protein
MSFASVLALPFAMGLVAGLRSFTALAAVCLAARAGMLHLEDSKLAFLGSKTMVWIAVILALLELIADKQSWIGARTRPGPLIDRLIMGAIAGGALGYSNHHDPLPGAVAGAVGALIGAYGGYRTRRRIVASLKVPDFRVALVEDAVAIITAFLLVFKLGLPS